MTPTSHAKRARLVEAAQTLIHRQGYGRTTLADIAQVSRVPLGNVYYYFKTKDDIAAAVIDRQLEELRTRFAQWESIPDPSARLTAFVDAVADNRDMLARYGCPIGSLCQELTKRRGALSVIGERMLKLQLDWVTKQFRLLGRADAVDLGQQLMAAIQGSCLLATALQNPALIGRQARRLKAWLCTL